MATKNYSFVAGDSGSKYAAVCKDNESKAVIPLVGGLTAKLRFWYGSGAATTKNMITRASPDTHIADYVFLPAELVAGKLNLEVEIYDAASLLLTQLDVVQVNVRKKKA